MAVRAGDLSGMSAGRSSGFHGDSSVRMKGGTALRLIRPSITNDFAPFVNPKDEKKKKETTVNRNDAPMRVPTRPETGADGAEVRTKRSRPRTRGLADRRDASRAGVGARHKSIGTSHDQGSAQSRQSSKTGCAAREGPGRLLAADPGRRHYSNPSANGQDCRQRHHGKIAGRASRLWKFDFKHAAPAPKRSF